MQLIRRGREIVRDEGWRSLWFRILGQTVYRRLLLIRTDLLASTFEADARCRWLSIDEAAVYSRFDPTVSAEEVRRRLQAGHRCFVLIDEHSEIVHGMWAAFRRARIAYLQQDLVLGAQEAYLYQSFTTPAHRGKRYATASTRALKHALVAEGFRATVACIQPDRRVAYPPVLRGGSVPTAYIGWIGVGPWRMAFKRVTDRYPWYAPKRQHNDMG